MLDNLFFALTNAQLGFAGQNDKFLDDITEFKDALVNFKGALAKKVGEFLNDAEDMKIAIANDDERIYVNGDTPWDDAEWIEQLEYVTEGNKDCVTATSNLGFCYSFESFTIDDMLAMVQMCKPYIKF